MTALTRCPRTASSASERISSGGGIAGLATAAFLIDDAHMSGENITIYKAAELPGGCLDCYPRGK